MGYSRVRLCIPIADCLAMLTLLKSQHCRPPFPFGCRFRTAPPRSVRRQLVPRTYLAMAAGTRRAEHARRGIPIVSRWRGDHRTRPTRLGERYWCDLSSRAIRSVFDV